MSAKVARWAASGWGGVCSLRACARCKQQGNRKEKRKSTNQALHHMPLIPGNGRGSSPKSHVFGVERERFKATNANRLKLPSTGAPFPDLLSRHFVNCSIEERPTT